MWIKRQIETMEIELDHYLYSRLFTVFMKNIRSWMQSHGVAHKRTISYETNISKSLMGNFVRPRNWH